MTKSVGIIGGGIIGLATGLKLKRKVPDLKLTIYEKESKLASHQTGHNSGVIHSGIYYKPGSLKATNCIKGYHELLEFCDEKGINYELCGKIIVATIEKELPTLNLLFERGQQNGLTGLKKLNSTELKDFEPHVNGIAGIHVPQTGIIDFAEVAEKYGEEIRERDGEIRLGTRVIDIKSSRDGVVVISDDHEEQFDILINCAGLYSDRWAQKELRNNEVRIIPFRGEYFKLRPDKEYLVKNLIYPVPDPDFPFLGVHFTRMIEGGVEAGPNAVLAFQREGYKKNQVNLSELASTIVWPGFQKVAFKYWKTGLAEMYRSFSKSAFTRALQKLVPEIKEEDLMHGGSGVRAQACDRNGVLLDDFKIITGNNTVHVCNAPSPAATSSLSIGETVAEMAKNFLSLNNN